MDDQKPTQPKQEEYPNLNRGNNNTQNLWALKYKTPEERLAMVNAYCDHIRQGFSDESFPGCDPEIFKNYLVKYAEEFGAETLLKVEQARKERRIFLERIGMNGSMGIPATYKAKVKQPDGTFKEETREAKGKFNDRSWKFIMQNMTGWKERHDVTSGDETIKMPTVFIPKEVEVENDE